MMQFRACCWIMLVLAIISLEPSQGFLSPVARQCRKNRLCLSSQDGEWKGEVSGNEGGKIRGCTIEKVGDSLTDYIITIDGVEADLGKFSQVIFRKVLSDAKQQRFQGFRPGTVPPQLLGSYKIFAMDECAREATMEAMEQNNIRAFESSRMDITFSDVSIPPPVQKKKKKTKKNKKKKGAPVEEVAEVEPEENEKEPEWPVFESIDAAVSGGWEPGQSFSFVAKNVKGQQLQDPSKLEGAEPLGASRFSAIDITPSMMQDTNKDGLF